MKKLFITCGLLSVITMCAPAVMAQSAPAPAQAPGAPARQQLTPDQRAEKQTEMMQKNLGLSSDQVTKVKQINVDFYTQIDKIRQSSTASGANQQDLRTQMKTARDKHDADLKTVLTSDQYTKMQQQMQSRGPRPATPAAAPTTPPQPQN